MAKLTGKKVRGRKKEALRIAAAELAMRVREGKPDDDIAVDVVVVPGEGRRKGETVTLTIPKGAVVVPAELLGDKTPENIRQQLRNGAEDAGKKVSLESFGWVADDGETSGTIYVMKAVSA